MEWRVETVALVLALGLFLPVCAQSPDSAGSVPSSKDESVLLQGYAAFRNADWSSATFFLRGALTSARNGTPEAWYMLIVSQMYSGDYESALLDCNSFLSDFPDSGLVSVVQYQKGRALHFLGQNENAVLVLSDFCHQHPDHEMYASGLYWIAECFYDDYNFDTARTMYERVVSEFPHDAKAADAQYKLDAISQRERERKLLYLLKVTGEEYLSARENFEKQLKQYATEDTMGLRRKLQEANDRIEELEAAAAETLAAAAAAQEASSAHVSSELRALKAKASQMQQILDEQYYQKDKE